MRLSVIAAIFAKPPASWIVSRCAFGINGEKTQSNGERPPRASLSNGEAQAAGQFPTIGIELAGVRHPFIWLAIAVRRTRLGEVRDETAVLTDVPRTP